MASINLEAIRDQIKEVSAIAASVPEPFRQKCFELLMTHLLNDAGGALPPLSALTPHLGSAMPFATPSVLGYSGAPPMTSLLHAFINKIGLASEQFNRVVGYLHGNVIFYREPDSSKAGQAQIDWALLLALKNAIMKGSFLVDPEEVRLMCQEKGIFERRNFYTNFRRHAAYFRTPPEPAGKPQPLSSKGIAVLGVLVKQLSERT